MKALFTVRGKNAVFYHETKAQAKATRNDLLTALGWKRDPENTDARPPVVVQRAEDHWKGRTY